MRRGFLAAVAALVLAVACGGSSGSSSGTTACVPGASIACAGPGACAGFQVCAANGTGYAPCDCTGGSHTDGGGLASAGDSGMSSAADGSASDSGGTTDSGGNGADAGPWTPAVLSGLSLWLDSDVGVVFDPVNTSDMIRWMDQSGHGNTATVINAGKGVFALDPKVQNGHDAFTCQAGWLQIPDDASLQWGTSDFTLAAVMRVNGQTTVYDKSTGNSVLRVATDASSSYSLQIGTHVLSLGGEDTSKFHVVIVQGQSMKLQVDATTATGVSTNTDLSDTPANITICSGGGAFTAEISEFIAVKGTLSATDLANLQGYLKTKFKL